MNKLWSYAPINIDAGLLILRVAAGLLVAVNHGWGKVERFMSGEAIKFYDFGGIGPQASLGLAAFAEFVCALLVVLGLFHRLALIPLVITFIVAAFMANADATLADREPALAYLFVFVTLLLTGPGKYSVDAARAGEPDEDKDPSPRSVIQ